MRQHSARRQAHDSVTLRHGHRSGLWSEGRGIHATQLSEVEGQAGRLVIRGYDIHELAGRVLSK